MVTQDTEFTPVVFRRDRSKNPEITVVFPCEPADCAGKFMTCYAHVGQHGSCGSVWYYSTRRAAGEQYADLFKELESIGYRLKVYSRIQPWMRDEFQKRVREQLTK